MKNSLFTTPAGKLADDRRRILVVTAEPHGQKSRRKKARQLPGFLMLCVALAVYRLLY